MEILAMQDIPLLCGMIVVFLIVIVTASGMDAHTPIDCGNYGHSWEYDSSGHEKCEHCGILKDVFVLKANKAGSSCEITRKK